MTDNAPASRPTRVETPMRDEALTSPSPPEQEADSGQWCELHNCHQDDPGHRYSYPECEPHLRDVAPSPPDGLRGRVEEVLADVRGRRDATITDAEWHLLDEFAGLLARA